MCHDRAHSMILDLTPITSTWVRVGGNPQQCAKSTLDHTNNSTKARLKTLVVKKLLWERDSYGTPCTYLFYR